MEKKKLIELRSVIEAISRQTHNKPPMSVFGDDNLGALRSLKFTIGAVMATDSNDYASYLYIAFGRYLKGEITKDALIKHIEDG